MTDAGGIRQLIESAHKAIRRGALDECLGFAHQALTRATRLGDNRTSAEALLVLGRAQLQDGDLQHAHQFGTMAAHYYGIEGDHVALAEALSLVSYASSSLGLPSAERRIGDLSLVLDERDVGTRARAMGQNYLGVAAFWDGDFVQSEAALEAARRYALEDGSPMTEFHPLVNSCFLEVMKLTGLEREVEVGVDNARLDRMVQRAQGLVDTWKTGQVDRMTAETGFLLLDFASIFNSLFMDDLDTASTHYRDCLYRAAHMPNKSWLHALVWWALAELTHRRGDRPGSLVAAHGMRKAASAGNHGPLVDLSQRLSKAYRRPDPRAA